MSELPSPELKKASTPKKIFEPVFGCIHMPIIPENLTLFPISKRCTRIRNPLKLTQFVSANAVVEFTVCSWILTILSYIFVAVTLPLSACLCIKVGASFAFFSLFTALYCGMVFEVRKIWLLSFATRLLSLSFVIMLTSLARVFKKILNYFFLCLTATACRKRVNQETNLRPNNRLVHD